MMSGMSVPPLVDEATRRSQVVWLALEDDPARPVWQVWHDGALWTVCGGAEQPLPAAPTAQRAVVAVRSKATRNDLLVTWVGAVSRVEPGSPVWEEVVPLLHEARLNAPDGEAQPQRWAAESLVLKVTPTGELLTC